jgi:hypothetical protein
MIIRALYSIPGLAQAAGISRHQMARLLRANGVAFLRSGRALMVPLHEIMRRVPGLWQSLVTLRRLAAEQGGPVQ